MEVLLKIKRTQIEMVRDRGFIIPQVEESLLAAETITFPGIENPTTDRYKMSKTYYHRITREQLNVYYLPAIGSLEYQIRELESGRFKAEITIQGTQTNGVQQEGDGDHKPSTPLVILIAAQPMTAVAYDIMTSVWPDSARVQYFQDEELYYNPTKGLYYSPHQLLSEEEKRELFRENNIAPQNLKRLLWAPYGTTVKTKGRTGDKHHPPPDQIVKYFGWQRDSVVQIRLRTIGEGSMATQTLDYRLVK